MQIGAISDPLLILEMANNKAACVMLAAALYLSTMDG